MIIFQTIHHINILHKTTCKFAMHEMLDFSLHQESYRIMRLRKKKNPKFYFLSNNNTSEIHTKFKLIKKTKKNPL